MNSKAFDYIIVGQGLAGSCLALQLLFSGKKILVIDKYDSNSATQVAAGLFNPIMSRKMISTWLVGKLFPYLHEFYTKAEHFTQSKFFFPMPLYLPFNSVAEQNEWMGRSTDENLIPFIDRVHTKAINLKEVHNIYGGLLVKQCGYVNTPVFSNAVKKCLEQMDCLLEEEFDESLLRIELESVTYKSYKASKIIFCTGEYATQSKYFSWLPVRPLKGETITIKPPVEVSTIYNRGVYLVPDIWKVGATYDLHDKARTITEQGKIELKEKLDQLISFPYTIEDQQWGFRPTTVDRRPILGPHPEHEQIVIFNGLGTKGVSLAPYFSGILAASMEKNIPLSNVVAVNRFKSLYWKSA